MEGCEEGAAVVVEAEQECIYIWNVSTGRDFYYN